MEQTFEGLMYEGYCDMVRTHVLAPIVDHMTKKGATCSVEEFEAILKLPVRTTQIAKPISSMGGIAIPSAVPSMGAKTQAKRSTKPISENNQCLYEFSKGAKSGQKCTSRRREGYLTCGTHSRYDDKVSKMNPSTGTTPQGQATTMPPPIAAPLMGMSTMPAMPNKTVAAMPTQAQERISVVNINDGFYYEAKSNMIFRQGPNAVPFACGNYNKANISIEPLTEAQVEECTRRGISYVDASVELPPLPADTQNKINAASKTNVPAIGSVSGSAPSLLPKIGMPGASMPGMQTMSGMSGMQTMSGMPSMPGFPGGAPGLGSSGIGLGIGSGLGLGPKGMAPKLPMNLPTVGQLGTNVPIAMTNPSINATLPVQNHEEDLEEEGDDEED